MKIPSSSPRSNATFPCPKIGGAISTSSPSINSKRASSPIWKRSSAVYSVVARVVAMGCLLTTRERVGAIVPLGIDDRDLEQSSRSRQRRWLRSTRSVAEEVCQAQPEPRQHILAVERVTGSLTQRGGRTVGAMYR